MKSWGREGSGNGLFRQPSSVIVGSAKGLIYVVDVGNNRVQRFDAFVRYLGKLGRQGNGDGEFSSPGDVVVDNNKG